MVNKICVYVLQKQMMRKSNQNNKINFNLMYCFISEFLEKIRSQSEQISYIYSLGSICNVHVFSMFFPNKKTDILIMHRTVHTLNLTDA